MGQTLGCASGEDPTKPSSAKKAEVRWEPIVAQLELPFEFQCDDQNMITKIAEDRALREGDYITHVDDVEVRGGSKAVADAVDESRELHTVMAQRQSIRKKGTSTFTVRLSPEDGKLGIGCTETNVIRELYRGLAAEKDGRLQVRAAVASGQWQQWLQWHACPVECEHADAGRERPCRTVDRPPARRVIL